MKPHQITLAPTSKSKFLIVALLLAGFCAAVLLRVAIGGSDVSHSTFAGLIFAVSLLLLAVATGVKPKVNKRVLLTGLLGGLFLCLPATFFQIRSLGAHTPDGNYLLWGVIVSIVAFTEEAFLRGVLYGRIAEISNQNTAIILAALAFALLHLPLYGWHALPLDFAVGLWLGALRYSSGSFIAPGIAHILADLAAWWI